MRRKVKLFIVYFPVILVACQVLVNLMSFVWYDGYVAAGFYLNTLFGVNFLFARFLLAFTYWFKFCAVSRAAAWAELAFGINFMIVQQDNLYNILFQVIVGTAALILTFRHFIRRFPLCSLALVWTFLRSVTHTGSCSKGMELWEKHTYHTIRQVHEHRF